MTKITFSNFENLNEKERDYAQKQAESFVQKTNSYVQEIDSLDFSLAERRRRDGRFGLSEVNLKMICSQGVYQSTASNWDKTRAVKEAFNKLEKQVKKKR